MKMVVFKVVLLTDVPKPGPRGNPFLFLSHVLCKQKHILQINTVGGRGQGQDKS